MPQVIAGAPARPGAPGELGPAGATAQATVVLVFVHNGTDGVGLLDDRLAVIAARHGQKVQLICCRPEQLPIELAVGLGPRPAVLALRDGVLVASAAGSTLPVAELERFVQRALDGAPANR